MPSPDVRALVDLTLFDKDAVDFYNDAKAVIDAKFPGWSEDEAQYAMVFLQALAVEAADLAVMVNRLPGAVLEGLLQLFSIVRSIGVRATATVTFTVADAAGHAIPAGSRVRWQSGSTTVDFTLDADLVIAAGHVTGTAAVTAVQYAADANGVAAATALQVVTALGYVTSAVLATSPVGGAGAEDDAAWMQRGVQTLARLVTTLVRPEHFTLAALDQVAQGIYRATTIARCDGTPGTHNGHVAVFVAGQGGALLSAPQKAAILAVLQGMASIELTAHVADATITAQAVTVTVAKTAEADAATVQAAVAAALAGFLNPDTWLWGGTIRFFDLIALIEDVDGVDHVVTLAAPAADVVLAGLANLVSLGAVVVTVV